MSLDLHRKQYEVALLAAMTANYPAIPIQFPNTPLVQPGSGFIAVNMVEGPSRQTDIGPRTIDRHTGFLQFDVLVPAMTGTTYVNQVAEFVGNLFRKQTFHLGDGARVVYRIPEFVSKGARTGVDTAKPGSADGFYAVIVRIPYWRDEAPA